MICPHCGKEHPDAAGFCPTTGKSISSNKSCPHCGESHPLSMQFCPKTGKEISLQSLSTKPKRKSIVRIVIILLALLSIGIGGAWSISTGLIEIPFLPLSENTIATLVDEPIKPSPSIELSKTPLPITFPTIDQNTISPTPTSTASQIQSTNIAQQVLPIPATVTQESGANNDNDTVVTNPLCKNDYFPVVKGAKWVYKLTTHVPNSEPFVMYILWEIAEILPDGFNMFIDVSQMDEFTPKDNPSDSYFKWICLSDGIASIYISGIAIPKDMSAGFTWKQASLTVPVGEIIYTSLGVESITVPAGIFNAVKVKQEFVPGQAKASFVWYVAGIGQVKEYNEYSGSSSSSELISYSIPK